MNSDRIKNFFLSPDADKGSQARALRSMEEVHSSVPVNNTGNFLKRFLSFAGPAYLVSVGYMDPGNWGTDLAGGAKFGYALIWVILASNLMAILLQTLCARLGIATGRDLAQACRDYYKKPAAVALWILCEIAIIACDLAEVIGSAVALNLLFGIPILWGVIITGFDVLLLLGALRLGFRKIEAIVLVLVSTIGICFLLEMLLSKPDWGGVLLGTVVPSVPNQEAFYIALGILGATVMPHNLYLHSALVQTRNIGTAAKDKWHAIRYNTWDTVVALGAAFFVNAAILILSAAVFHSTGHFDVEDLGDAHRLLTPLLGTSLASTAFAVALLASGQSSTITGTLAGQIVMEGFMHIRLKPWLRRIISRLLAIIPAIILIQATGGKDTVGLLVLSQVVLSMQLPFAIFPLLMFTSNPKHMGEFANPTWLKFTGYAVCVVIAVLNIYLLFQIIGLFWLLAISTAGAGFAFWVTFIYQEKDDHEDSRKISARAA